MKFILMAFVTAEFIGSSTLALEREDPAAAELASLCAFLAPGHHEHVQIE